MAIIAVANLKAAEIDCIGASVIELDPIAGRSLIGFDLVHAKECSVRRLHHPQRLVVKIALVAVAGTLLGVTGAVVWAIIFGVVVAGMFAIGELTTTPGGHDHADRRTG